LQDVRANASVPDPADAIALLPAVRDVVYAMNDTGRLKSQVAGIRDGIEHGEMT
jgi:hypothetical protein